MALQTVYKLQRINACLNGVGYSSAEVINGIGFGHDAPYHLHTSNHGSVVPYYHIPGALETGGFFGDEICRGVLKFDLQSITRQATQAFLDFEVLNMNEVHPDRPFLAYDNGGVFEQEPFDGEIRIFKFTPPAFNELASHVSEPDEGTIATFTSNQSAVGTAWSFDITTHYNQRVGGKLGFVWESTETNQTLAANEGAVVFGNSCLRLVG